MCGINGLITKEKNINLIDFVHEMNDLILHRGPDGEGFYNHMDKVVFGMRRLSVIDLDTGSQPMYNNDNTIAIVFNGEIYNFLELKDTLIKSGIIFKTKSDTEVILKGYEMYGTLFFDMLNGMFSFSIHDLNKNKVLIARDKVGEKPLYYFHNENLLIFSSELKSIKKIYSKLTNEKLEICKSALNIYLSLTFIPAPFTIFEKIHKLSAGNYIELDTIDFKSTIHTFANKNYINFNYDPPKISYLNAQNTLTYLLNDSVEKRMISDVSIGSFLSGGVDSSIITAIMSSQNTLNKIQTFSITSKNKLFDESARSNAVAKHLNTYHTPIDLDFKELRNMLDEVILNYDEPFGDSSALATYYIAKKTKNDVTVALTGDGGDEVFGGYNRYFMPFLAKNYRKYTPNIIHNLIIKPFSRSIKNKNDNRGKLFKIKKFINSVGENELQDLSNIISLGFLEKEKENLYQSEYNYEKNSYYKYFQNIYNNAENLTTLSKSRFIDISISLEGDMLVKVDRASMLASLECRAPFLDTRLIDFSFSLPDDFLIKGNETKYILKDTFKKMLPKGLFDMQKSGFGVPVGDWLRSELRIELISLTNEQFLHKQKIFNPVIINQLVVEHLHKNMDNTFKLWTIFCFQKWWLNFNNE